MIFVIIIIGVAIGLEVAARLASLFDPPVKRQEYASASHVFRKA